jgi:hypothetical protein
LADETYKILLALCLLVAHLVDHIPWFLAFVGTPAGLEYGPRPVVSLLII